VRSRYGSRWRSSLSELADSWIGRAGGEVVDLGQRLSEFAELSAALAPPHFQLEVEHGELRHLGLGEFELTVRAHLLPPADLRPSVQGMGLVEIDIETLEGELRLETLELPSGLQKQRLGSLLIAQLAALGDLLALERFCLQAGRIGRWAWMRCGFDFRDPSDRACVVAAAERFAVRLGLAPDLSSVTHSWDFLDLQGTLSAEEIRAAGGPAIEPEDAPIPLAKALLLGPGQDENVWFGEMDLDPRSASRVRLRGYAP
jgi:hypothetical protein